MKLRLAVHVEDLWNEWEIQVLVLASFSLQVFLLLFSGVRKRATYNILSFLLWLAYVSADSLAIFVLGHLTFHIYGGLRHGLVLFWAPFMLLHLGGQETMTAFSMEDNLLWRRHLLNFVIQVLLAAYVVGKQWKGESKQLLAPMVLMFISGTIKYAGRISALMLAAEQTTRRSRVRRSRDSLMAPGYRVWLLPDWLRIQELTNYKRLILEANKSISAYMGFLMDIALPPTNRASNNYNLLQQRLSTEQRVYACYKLTELQLSNLYDYFYTKIGAHFEKEERLNGWFLQLVTLGSTFAALFLFAWADLRGNLFYYKRADIIVSYILLAGAAILDTLSVSIVISSFQAVQDYGRSHDVMFSIIRCVHPEGKAQWSHKLAQYNLISGCIQEKRAAAGGCGFLECIMFNVLGMNPSHTTYVDVSHELKKELLDKLIQVGGHEDDVWDISKFTGQWAKLELQSKMQIESSSRAHLQVLLSDSIDRAASFMSSVLTWHILTDICFFHEDDTGCSSSSGGPSREFSNYMMYLCSEYGMYSGSDAGNVMLQNAQGFIYDCLGDCQESLDQISAVVRHITAKLGHLTPTEFVDPREKLINAEPALILAFQLSEELLKIKEASDRWDIILNVWMEMLCYMAFHCESGFHVEHLSKGGEFITHQRPAWEFREEEENSIGDSQFPLTREVEASQLTEENLNLMACVVVATCYHRQIYPGLSRLAAHVEELWNEWEIQVLVLVSFSLQVFLLLFSGIRKRTTSKLLITLLWLAFVSADSLSIFVLGHLTYHINVGLRHGLVLFWAPFMLLHLGGQETMTAFSMEDNMLWKRHLLTFSIQMGLAAYVVSKQCQGDNKHLLAPMVLMFISGTIKYAGRISALMLAAEPTTVEAEPIQELTNYKLLVLGANRRFRTSIGFLMDKELPLIYMCRDYYELLHLCLSTQQGVNVFYKLIELQLSILYDYFYTKIGAHFEKEERLNGWFLQLVTLGSTFAPLFLFAWADLRGNLFNYSRADIIVYYILLGGAAILDTLSVSIVILSFQAVKDERRCHDVFFSTSEREAQWSHKLAQYNLISGCIKEKRAAAGSGGGLLKCIMLNVVGMNLSHTTYVDISHELKKQLLDKQTHVGHHEGHEVWDISKFTGQWAKLELQSKIQIESSSKTRLQALLGESIERAASFMSSVLTWHIATEICFFSCSSSSGGPSRELSNYVMYLSSEYGMYSGSDAGNVMLQNAQGFIYDYLGDCRESLDQISAVVRHITAKLVLTFQLSKELFKIQEANDRWDIILNVWMEMLCYMACNCEAGFHIEQLSKGGEFITHVKLLVLNLNRPYSLDP
uniref:DUF4220 domain-containing protein n=1 Tax=Leersia perrieri TaxID=77586 RepID=A0A0D9X469_9ORYZ